MPALELALDAAGQMGLDEAVLMLASSDSLILRFYRWADFAVTYGYSQPWTQAAAAAKARGWPSSCLARRSTGGGIVFHDGDVTFSLVFPWERLCSPGLVYKNIHRGAHLGLKGMGLETFLWSPPAARRPGLRAECFSAPEPVDLVDGQGRKLLGGALRKHGERGLYQGSLRLQSPASRARIEEALARGVSAEFGRPARQELEEGWIREGRRLAEKYRSPSWNQRR